MMQDVGKIAAHLPINASGFFKQLFSARGSAAELAE